MLKPFKILKFIILFSLTYATASANDKESAAAHARAALQNVPAEMASLQILSETQDYHHYHLTPTPTSTLETVHEALCLSLAAEFGPAGRRTETSQHWTQTSNDTQIAVMQKDSLISLVIDSRRAEVTHLRVYATARGKPVRVIYAGPKSSTNTKQASTASLRD